ncbi:hypothetical protein DACRYDRAFT_24675, partial [Dacryopinax primogenitus]
MKSPRIPGSARSTAEIGNLEHRGAGRASPGYTVATGTTGGRARVTLGSPAPLVCGRSPTSITTPSAAAAAEYVEDEVPDCHSGQQLHIVESIREHTGYDYCGDATDDSFKHGRYCGDDSHDGASN